jgi:cyclohexadienyl dehydratase
MQTLNLFRGLQACMFVLACAGTLPASAGEVLDRVLASGLLRVCIWPDYYGMTYRKPMSDELTGMDIDLSVQFARELGVRLRYVDSSGSAAPDDLRANACDIAMFAIAITPERVARMRFSIPYLQSDVYAIAHRGGRTVRKWEDIDQPGVLVAVQAGTFLEPVMTERLKHARVVPISPPATREGELMAGRVDVFMTNFTYGRRLVSGSNWARVISPPRPFYVRPYAYATVLADVAWGERVDAFVAAVRSDGRLKAAATRYGLQSIMMTAP